MGEAAWKVTQRRITRIWGAESAWRGEKGSDARGPCPVSLEVKRSKRRVPEGRWIDQAIAQGKAEDRPWILVVVGHGDRHPIAVVDHDWLRYLAGEAGLLEERLD